MLLLNRGDDTAGNAALCPHPTRKIIGEVPRQHHSLSSFVATVCLVTPLFTAQRMYLGLRRGGNTLATQA